jgi:hypothetical protein
VRGAICTQSMHADINVLATQAFLEAMQKRDEAVAPSESYWEQVAATGATANPQVQSYSQRRTKP